MLVDQLKKKKNIDWVKRYKQLETIAEEIKAQNNFAKPELLNN